MRLLSLPTRMILRLHLRVIGFVMFTLLVVAYSIDLPHVWPDLKAQGGIATLRYLAYRGADIVARLLPMACLAGAFFAELLRRQRLEPVILSAAGASPLVMLRALALAGLLLGGLQLALEVRLRPAAVFAQVEMGLGRYASRFAPGLTDPQWIVTENRAIRARMARGGAPEMRDVMLFTGLDGAGLQSVVTARLATPVAQAEWRLQQVTEWRAGPDGRLAPHQSTEKVVQIPLSAAHLRYYGVPALYLPQPALRQVLDTAGAPAPHDARTALLRRYAALFLPGICALLGAALGQVAWRARKLDPFRAVGLAALGYVSVVSVKIFWALGEFAAIPPLWAAFGGATWMAVLASALMLRQRAGP